MDIDLFKEISAVEDEVLSDLEDALGERRYRIYLCYVTWDGGTKFKGIPSSKIRSKLSPTPKILRPGAITSSFAPGGELQEGELIVKGLSFAKYIPSILQGEKAEANQSFHWEVEDLDDKTVEYFEPTQRCYKVPGELGWTVILKRSEKLDA